MASQLAANSAAAGSAGSGKPAAAADDEVAVPYPPWRILARRSHILPSEGPRWSEFRRQLDLPTLPDMVFDRNRLRLEHAESGCSLEFSALGALRLVDAASSSLRLAVSERWLSTRREFAQQQAQQYDWTFASEYTGTALGDWRVEPAAPGDAIDLEKLRRRDQILFYCDCPLYEDELGDSGTAQMSLRFRAMPRYCLLLLRYFMRADDTLARCWDTRIYWEAGWGHLLREVKRFESPWQHISHLPATTLTDPSALQEHLAITSQSLDRLVFEKSSSG